MIQVINKQIKIVDFVAFKKELVKSGLGKNGKLAELLINYRGKLYNRESLIVTFTCTEQVKEIFTRHQKVYA